MPVPAGQPAMSQLENTSAILGEYMLKGWTLTDLHCSSCHITPLMREPAAAAQRENRERVQFCALCDGRPEGRPLAPAPAPASAPAPGEPSRPSSTLASQPGVDQTHTAGQAGPSQSEAAANSISDLLLRGHSLLNENCPSPQCRGIPLVGYPRKADGSKDGRKMCVSCDTRWADENALAQGDVKISGLAPESPRSRMKRELYGIGVDHRAAGDKGKGKRKEVEVDQQAFEAEARESAERLQRQAAQSRTQAGRQGVDVDMEEGELEGDIDEEVKPSTTVSQPSKITAVPSDPQAPAPGSPLSQSLSQTSDSLAHTLSSLSASLEQHVSRPVLRRNDEDSGRWFVDLKLHTEAIKDVLAVIGQVERARHVG
ncbi:hypothetical protein IAU60_004419 [Kwoniella sp. DSM 27419]